MSKPISGGCECGAVRYETEAEPLMSGICHCRQCQRASGAGSNPFIVVPKASVAITGEVRYFDTTGDSGKASRRGFCPTCGCRLLGMAELAPDLMAISIGSLDDPSTFQPGMRIYASSAQPWDRIPDDLPAFPALPPIPEA